MKNLTILTMLFAAAVPTQAMAADNCARSSMDAIDCANIVADLEAFNDDFMEEFGDNTLNANLASFFNDPDFDFLNLTDAPAVGAICDADGLFLLGFDAFAAFSTAFGNVTFSNPVLLERTTHATTEDGGTILFEFNMDFSIDIGPGGPLTGVLHGFQAHTIQENDEDSLRIGASMAHGSFLFD